jgi:hypothetical protein
MNRLDPAEIAAELFERAKEACPPGTTGVVQCGDALIDRETSNNPVARKAVEAGILPETLSVSVEDVHDDGDDRVLPTKAVRSVVQFNAHTGEVIHAAMEIDRKENSGFEVDIAGKRQAGFLLQILSSLD